MHTEAIEPTDLGSPQKKMEHARLFFESEFDVRISATGRLEQQVTEDQLRALAEWRTNTCPEGIDMMSEDLFYQKVLLASALMPQVNAAGDVQYLFGKGVAVELAKLGEVDGRVKHQSDVPYRSHSDFEIYGVEGASVDLEGSEQFIAVFGNQEYFPPAHTKGLRELKDAQLVSNAERVDLGGVIFVVPQLETQFVDKAVVNNERVERGQQGMLDAEMLSTLYDLDPVEVEKLLDMHVFAPALSEYNVKRQVSQLRKQLSVMDAESVQDHFRIGVGRQSIRIPNSLDVTELSVLSDEQIATRIDEVVFNTLQQWKVDILAMIHSTTEARRVVSRG